MLNNPVLIWAAFSTPSSQPKKPTTARNIVDKLVERFGDSPYAVAETVIKEKCHIAGTKSHNKAMAKAVAEQLQEVVKSAEEAAKKDTRLYHFGHDFLAEVANDIITIEDAAAKS